MLILKHLKTLQHVSIIILIIFRELVCSLLNSVTLTRNIRAPEHDHSTDRNMLERF